jgi:hypothetical protein
MKMTVHEKDERLEVSLHFPDSRFVDLELALHIIAKENRWNLQRLDLSLDHVQYRVDASGTFIATIHFTHGLEPPTKAIIENKSPDEVNYRAAAKSSVIWVAKALLEECAARGLVSQSQKGKAIAELSEHDRELTGSR